MANFGPNIGLFPLFLSHFSVRFPSRRRGRRRQGPQKIEDEGEEDDEQQVEECELGFKWGRRNRPQVPEALRSADPIGVGNSWAFLLDLDLDSLGLLCLCEFSFAFFLEVSGLDLCIGFSGLRFGSQIALGTLTPADPPPQGGPKSTP